MNSPDLSTLLEECLQLAGTQRTALHTETCRPNRDELSADLKTLLQEAVEMRWPFVEEKWQYKSSVTSEDKVNTKDLVSRHLPQLMGFLKSSIVGAEPLWAMSVVFLVDRFLYWKDSSHTLLKIAKALHRRYPETPVAPQVVIRQARVYLNTGKLQKAEYILSSLIDNNGATGCWKYQRDSDRILVQAVSLQVRGQVLQKLGLWLEAAELIWASLIGFYVLPLPDKKGIGTSFGLLASMLISMNDQDFATFQKRPHINLGFLGDCRHRLLCAAQAAKRAVVFSQFDSLYVLTHMVTQGTCLLSYSFSRECPAAEKLAYLALAKEAFENGLLTKTEKDLVTSQQELHTLIKAAYCLAITNKWMLGPVEAFTMAIQACQEANALLYSYCFKDDSDKVLLSSEVMVKVQQVKALLKVKEFTSSELGSFIPDSYRAAENRPAVFTLDDFTKMIECFQKHHRSVCEAFKGQRSGQAATHANCLTAFQTTVAEPLTTECSTRGLGEDDANKGMSDSSGSKVSLDSSNEVFRKETFDVTLDRDTQQSELRHSVKSEAQSLRTSQGSRSLGSSWPNTPSSGASFVLVDPFCCTEADEDQVSGEKISHPSSHVEYNHQSLLPPSHSARDLNEGVNAQQQPKGELCTTLQSEDHETTNKSTNNATGNSKDGRTSSGSLSSSLGSSWQSVSFSTSPLSGGGLSKTSKGCHPQLHLQNVQSSIETVEDLDVLSLSNGLSGLTMAEDGPNGLSDQQQSKQELCTTLESTEYEAATNSLATNATGKSQDTRTSSCSLNSSLGSSWQSFSLSRSPPVDEICGTNEDSPDSPFQLVKPNCSGTAGLTKTQKAYHPQTPVENQSSFETVEDLDVLSLSDGLSGHAVAGNDPNGLIAQQQPKQELCTTLDSEDHETTNKSTTNATGSSKDTRTSSGSLSSSLGSSWQSVSFSTSPLSGDLAEVLRNKPTIDQNSEAGNVDGLSGLVPENGLNAEELSAKHSSLKLQEGPLFLPTELDSFVMVPSDSEPSLTKQGATSSANQGKRTSPEDSLMIAHPHETAAEDDQRPTCSKLEPGLSQKYRIDMFPSYMTCDRCFQGCMMGDVVVTEQDYRSLFSGVCQGCLLRRLPDQTFKLREFSRAYSAVLLKYSKATESWMGSETSVYVGEVLQVAVEGRQRQAFRIQYLHQEQLLGSYVGKEYLRGRKPHAHLADVERQMTAQYYVMEFNKRLYESNMTTQIFYIPSELLLITEADRVVGCVSVEPYMLGDFVKLTNNTTKINKQLKATKYGIAFSHFTYAFSNQQEVVVDLQGWVSANGKGLAYLTDPQIHSLRKPKSPSNFHQNGIIKFLQEQHGEHCGPICQAALHSFTQYLL